MLESDLFQISEIIAAKAVGNITEERQEALDKWLAESGSNRAAYEKFISGEETKSRDMIAGMIVREDFIRGVEKKIRRLRRRKLLARYASVAAAIIAGAVLWLLPPDGKMEDDIAPRSFTPSLPILSINGSDGFVLKNDGENEWRQIVAEQAGRHGELPDDAMNVRINVPRGGLYRMQLDDGTLVWLNAETTIEYPGRFTADKRQVYIAGEAYFEVTPDADRPFVINTVDGVGITVRGTKFNVNSYADQPEIRVTLVEGSVDVRHNGHRVRLTPDRQAIFDRADHELTVRNISVSEYVAWKDGIFDFQLASITEILKTMERAYDIEFIINGVDISAFGEFTLTTDRGESFARVEDILEKITGLSFRTDGRKVFVTK